MRTRWGYIIDLERSARIARDQWHEHKHKCATCNVAANERFCCLTGSNLFKAYERSMVKLGNTVPPLST